MPRKPIDPASLNQEQLLCLEVWKLAQSTGRVELRFATEAEAKRARFQFYTVAKPVKDGRLNLPDVLSAIQDVQVRLEHQEGTALPHVVSLVAAGGTALAERMKVLLGRSIGGPLPQAAVPMAPQPQSAAPPAPLSALTPSASTLYENARARVHERAGVPPPSPATLSPADALASANRIMQLAAQPEAEAKPEGKVSTTPYYTRET